MVNIICPCDKIFTIFPSRIGRKKYCSKFCFYKFHGRRSGLKYRIRVRNITWFKKNSTPWNKGKTGEYLLSYKGESAKINTKHKWIYRWFGRPIKCEKCGTKKRLQWSNKTETYKRSRDDWQTLCVKCHQRYDYENFNKRESFYKKI